VGETERILRYWDRNKKRFSLTIEVHGDNCIEESVDDTDYTIATDKSLLLEMLAKE